MFNKGLAALLSQVHIWADWGICLGTNKGWDDTRVQIFIKEWDKKKTTEKSEDKQTFFLFFDSEQRECQNLVTFGILYNHDWQQLLPGRVWKTGPCKAAWCGDVWGHDWHCKLERSTAAAILYRQPESGKILPSYSLIHQGVQPYFLT